MSGFISTGMRLASGTETSGRDRTKEILFCKAPAPSAVSLSQQMSLPLHQGSPLSASCCLPAPLSCLQPCYATGSPRISDPAPSLPYVWLIHIVWVPSQNHGLLQAGWLQRVDVTLAVLRPSPAPLQPPASRLAPCAYMKHQSEHSEGYRLGDKPHNNCGAAACQAHAVCRAPGSGEVVLWGPLQSSTPQHSWRKAPAVGR